ncbi:MAG: putative peptidoglycan lipid II flippase [Candidatus Poriferisodalaceae bacterium]|jgi:putative peptidoglycan lipid II flippase
MTSLRHRMRRMRGTPVIAIGIALSRLTGLLRTAIVVNIFGVTRLGDAFAAAMRIPNVIQNLLGEGALSASFIPEYSKLKEEDEAAAGVLAGAIASFLLLVASLLALIGVVFARPVTRAITWGWSGEQLDTTVNLVRILSIGAGFLVLSAWCLGVLNSHRRFFLSYVAPVLWNATQIAVLLTVGLLAWDLVDRATALAWAVVAGGVVQVAVQIPAVRRANTSISLNAGWNETSARKVIGRLGPAVLGRGALQISAFLDLALASLLAAGATTAIASSQPLYILPISIIAMSVAAAELPELSTLTDQREVLRRTSERVARVMFLITLIVVIYLVAGDHVVWGVFSFGGLVQRLDSDEILLIAFVLGTFSLGLPAIGGSRQLQNVLYAVGDTRTPARISFTRVCVSFTFGIIAMFQLDRLVIHKGEVTGFSALVAPLGPLAKALRDNDDVPLRLGAVGLAAGAAMGAWLEYALLKQATQPADGTQRPRSATVRQQLSPVLAAMTVAIVLRTFVPLGPRLIESIVVGVATIVVYMAVGVLTGHPTATMLADRFTRKT